MIKTFKRQIKYKVVQRLYCDKCGTEMESTGIVYTSYPPSYPHVCPKCGEGKVTSEIYPNSFEELGRERKFKYKDKN